MTEQDVTAIPLSKTKMALLLAGSLAFIAIGGWMLQLDVADLETGRRNYPPWFIRGLGTVAIVFFGLCGVVAVRRLFDRKPGLILNSAGIHDRSSGVSAGLIPWSDIEGFDLFEIRKQRMLIIRVADPAKYVERGGAMKRALNRANFKLCGSPIAISASTLKVNFDELVALCNRYFREYRSRS